MTAVFNKIFSTLKDAWDYIPNPLHWVFGEPWPDLSGDEVSECEFCKQDDAIWDTIPDDLREYKLEKEFTFYNLKLDKIKPRHWKVLGTNLLNMAYRDPCHSMDYEDQATSEEELPPPEEPSEAVKAEEEPVININLKNLTCFDLEELGESFFEWADDLETTLKGEKWPGYPYLPYYHSQPPGFYEEMDEIKFDPDKKIYEELTDIKYLTLSDFVPDVPKQPYRSDADELFSYKQLYPPPVIDPEIIELEEKERDAVCVEDSWMTHKTEDPFLVPEPY